MAGPLCANRTGLASCSLGNRRWSSPLAWSSAVCSPNRCPAPGNADLPCACSTCSNTWPGCIKWLAWSGVSWISLDWLRSRPWNLWRVQKSKLLIKSSPAVEVRIEIAKDQTEISFLFVLLIVLFVFDHNSLQPQAFRQFCLDSVEVRLPVLWLANHPETEALESNRQIFMLWSFAPEVVRLFVQVPGRLHWLACGKAF